MRVVVVGAGQVGHTVVKSLAEAHECTMIEIVPLAVLLRRGYWRVGGRGRPRRPPGPGALTSSPPS
ncbi:hypothetical protein [Streptomyces caelestis]|uniref:hypothetical protein n=1 Tax=Streptomyces caelestis TaxID=36816 RepID=UPI0036475F49